MMLVEKNLPDSAGNTRDVGSFIPWAGKIPLKEKTETHSSILAWGITWAEGPGGLQFMGLQGIWHN